jgi:hypothetical protein
VFALQNGNWITSKGVCTKANDQQAGRAVGNCLKRFALRNAESAHLGPLRQWQIKRSPCTFAFSRAADVPARLAVNRDATDIGFMTIFGTANMIPQSVDVRVAGLSA